MTRDTLVIAISLIAFLIAFATYRINRRPSPRGPETGVDDVRLSTLFHDGGITDA